MDENGKALVKPTAVGGKTEAKMKSGIKNRTGFSCPIFVFSFRAFAYSFMSVKL